MRNASDNIYGSDGGTLLLSITADGAGGYAGSYTFGLSAGTATSSTDTSTSTSTSTCSSASSATSDTSVGAALGSATCTRSSIGTRSVAAKLHASEQLALDVRVRRGSRTIAQRPIARLAAGTRTVRVPLGRNVKQGRATLQIVARDMKGNRKVLSKIVHVPAKG